MTDGSRARLVVRKARETLIHASRRYSRTAHEVEDLAHDVILSALRRGLPLDSETFLQSARGAARRHAAFLARSAGRRRAREACSSSEPIAADDVAAPAAEVEGAPLSTLSPSLRTTLLLLFTGFDKAELRLALGLTDAALRKRFQALREHGPLARPELPIATRTPAHCRLRRSQIGLLSRLTAALVGGGRARRVLAAGDPDGHGLIFVEVLTPSHRTATSVVSATTQRTRTKGSPCSTRTSRTSPSSSS